MLCTIIVALPTQCTGSRMNVTNPVQPAGITRVAENFVVDSWPRCLSRIAHGLTSTLTSDGPGERLVTQLGRARRVEIAFDAVRHHEPRNRFAYDPLGAASPAVSMEAMAARLCADLAAFQPEGPGSLAGYSFAGLLAYEMARQLRASGREIRLLAIFDTGPDLSAARRGTRRGDASASVPCESSGLDCRRPYPFDGQKHARPLVAFDQETCASGVQIPTCCPWCRAQG